MLFINNTGSVSRIGYICKIDPKNPNAIVYVSANETNCIGVVASSVPNKSRCEVITFGPAKVVVNGNINKGDTLRSRLSSDGSANGVAFRANSSTPPFLQIGTALESGRGLIKCNIGIYYFGGGGSNPEIDTIDGGNASSVYAMMGMMMEMPSDSDLDIVINGGNS